MNDILAKRAAKTTPKFITIRCHVEESVGPPAKIRLGKLFYLIAKSW